MNKKNSILALSILTCMLIFTQTTHAWYRYYGGIGLGYGIYPYAGFGWGIGYPFAYSPYYGYGWGGWGGYPRSDRYSAATRRAQDDAQYYAREAKHYRNKARRAQRRTRRIEMQNQYNKKTKGSV